jgi:hypothetical protein
MVVASHPLQSYEKAKAMLMRAKRCLGLETYALYSRKENHP